MSWSLSTSFDFSPPFWDACKAAGRRSDDVLLDATIDDPVVRQSSIFILIKEELQ